MTTAERTYTVEEYMALPDVPGLKYELWEGRLVQMSAGAEHVVIATTISAELVFYNRQHTLGGIVFGDNAAFTIDAVKGTYFSPDAAYVVAGRVSRPLPVEVPIAPDLVVEVLSPHNYEHPGEFRRKIGLYQSAGVRLIWAVDIRDTRVQVYRLGSSEPENVGIDGTLDGGDVLPGFSLAVQTIFDVDN